jgi:uncharacterized protein (TIGR02466 family)
LSQDPLDQAKAFLDAGRLEEALAITRPLAERQDPSHRALAMHSTTLKGLGRREEALAFDERAAKRFPTSGVAWHNLAATLGDLGQGAEAVQAMEQAFRLGLDGALSWGVMARARAAAGDLDGAEEAYRQALRRAPGRAETAAEYADLVWMRRGDLAGAQAILDHCAHAGGPPAPLLLTKAKVFEAAGQPEKGVELLALAAQRLPDDMAVTIAASQAALEAGRLDEAERLAAAAEARLPESPGVLNQRLLVHLARGEADLALAKALKGLAFDPGNQSLWGWAATAARIVGDPLHRELYDFDNLVGAYDIAPPAGWTDLPSYLADLAAALDRIHVYATHPSSQSLRHGSQTTYRLTGSRDPAIRAFFTAVDAPIRAHMAKVAQAAGPAAGRHTGGYRIEGAWSVRLKPGGFHKDHFHPEGWLSSAFYVETPDAALDTTERQGWIRFGRPPYATEPPLDAEHYIRPRPGRLVLFPSYMWHGTVPFTTAERRMTIAFDIVPA